MKNVVLYLLLFSLLICSCREKQSLEKSTVIVKQDLTHKDNPSKVFLDKDLSKEYPSLVDIQEIDSTLQIDLKYATSDNFLGKILYDSIRRIFLQKEVAEKLKVAQSLLKVRHSNYSLLVYDGARPFGIQQEMWNALDSIPPVERGKFLSNPKNGGSIHNYGAAVDLTIVDEHKKPLDMGADYDDIRKIAYPRFENYYFSIGKLTQKQIENRKLLREIMSQAGFKNIATEWWHFNACSRNEAIRKYPLIQ